MVSVNISWKVGFAAPIRSSNMKASSHDQGTGRRGKATSVSVHVPQYIHQRGVLIGTVEDILFINYHMYTQM